LRLGWSSGPLTLLMSSQAAFAELAVALRERLAAIADREHYARDPSSHLQRLQSASERVTELQSRLPQPVDPQLAHFLQRCSYDKALAWLEERA